MQYVSARIAELSNELNGRLINTSSDAGLIGNVGQLNYGAAKAALALMVVVMTLSDVLNNTATAVIGAPIAMDVAAKLGVNSDPFLMAVAIAASCFAMRTQSLCNDRLHQIGIIHACMARLFRPVR